MIYPYKNYYPFFTVIVSTFNRRNLLSRAFNSLLEQDELDWECIIVEDGSKDDCFDIAKNLINEHPNFRYLYHSNRGHGLTRNAGILASVGKYITFLDSDDEYKKNHLKLRKEFLLDNSQYDFLYSKAEIVGNPYVPDMNNIGKEIHLDNCVIGGTFVIKRESAIRIGGFSDLRFGDDFDFFNRAKSFGLKITELDYKTYIYHRDTADSLCNNYFLKDSNED